MWLARLTPAASPSCHALWLCGRVSVLTAGLDTRLRPLGAGGLGWAEVSGPQ